MRNPTPATSSTASAPAATAATVRLPAATRAALPALRRSVSILKPIAARLAAGFRDGLTTTWRTIGSGQVLNLVLAALVLLAGFMAQRVERIERHLDGVAEAQRITGFAVMKQLQALGLAPKDGDAGKPPSPAPAPIDPALLEGHPGTRAAPVPAPTAPAPALPAAAVAK